MTKLDIYFSTSLVRSKNSCVEFKCLLYITNRNNLNVSNCKVQRECEEEQGERRNLIQMIMQE
jgi:hypothetical protein